MTAAASGSSEIIVCVWESVFPHSEENLLEFVNKNKEDLFRLLDSDDPENNEIFTQNNFVLNRDKKFINLFIGSRTSTAVPVRDDDFFYFFDKNLFIERMYDNLFLPNKILKTPEAHDILSEFFSHENDLYHLYYNQLKQLCNEQGVKLERLDKKWKKELNDLAWRNPEFFNKIVEFHCKYNVNSLIKEVGQNFITMV